MYAWCCILHEYKFITTYNLIWSKTFTYNVRSKREIKETVTTDQHEILINRIRFVVYSIWTEKILDKLEYENLDFEKK